jgi:hypothetical protein
LALGFHTAEHKTVNNSAVYFGYVYICSYCQRPTFFDVTGKQYPGASFGNPVGALPPDVAALYNHARACVTVNAFTAAVLTCRKLLMHLAVEKGADEGKSFLEYVQYLADRGYMPPNGRGWVDHIRTKGNEANHEITVMSDQDAKDLIIFSEMLLNSYTNFRPRSNLLHLRYPVVRGEGESIGRNEGRIQGRYPA